ncbi:MAG: hypothetical protein PVH28_03455 [Desulfobacterales bacterium]|jgi:hypothetical protein
MKKPAAISLVFLFSVTVLLSGAFGYSDCAAECAHEIAKVHAHASMGSATLTEPNCCSGAMKHTCEMGRMFEIKIPECSTAHPAPVFPKPNSIGYLPNNFATDHFRLTPFNPQISADEKRPKRPVYLETLSILC